MFCTQCGTTNSEHQAYCQACGTDLQSIAPPLNFTAVPSVSPCTTCGSAPLTPVRYCQACGATVDMVAPQQVPVIRGGPWSEVFTDPNSWVQGAIGAVVASATTWLVALLVRILLMRSMSQFLGQMADGNPVLENLKPSIGLIYAMLHQAPVALSASLKELELAASLTLQLPILLGLVVVVLALRLGAQTTVARLSGKPLHRALQVGICVALPYALISTFIGWVGGVTIRTTELGAEFRGTVSAQLNSLFLSALVLAFIVAALTTYGASKEQHVEKSPAVGRWFPAMRQAVRSLAFGLILTLVLTTAGGLLFAKPGRTGAGIGNLVRSTSPVDLSHLPIQDAAIGLAVVMPVVIADVHGLAHFLPLQVSQVQSNGRQRSESIHLFSLPEDAPRWLWLLGLVPLYTLLSAGYQSAKTAGAKGNEAVLYGSVTGIIYAFLLALLLAAARLSLYSSMMGERAGFAVGAEFVTSLLIGALVCGAVGATGGYLSQKTWA